LYLEKLESEFKEALIKHPDLSKTVSDTLQEFVRREKEGLIK